MNDLWSIPLVTTVLSAILMCIMLMYALMHRQERGVRYFVWVLCCRVVYAGSVILELHRTDLQSKLIFRNIEQTALLFMVPLMVLFVLDLVGKDKWLRLRWILPLLALFACWAVVIWADPYWHIINRTQDLINGHLVMAKTPYAIAFNLMCYTILAGCIFVLIRYIRSSRPEFRVAGIWLLLFGSIPFSVEVMKLFMPALSPWLLPLSVYTGIGGMIMLWIIVRKKLFTSVPMARNIVVETMREGMLIMNTTGKIIDSNRLARLLLETVDDNRPILGRSSMEVLAAWPEWQSACASMEASRIEISSGIGREKQSYIVNVYPFFTQRKRKLGTISIIIDITEKQQALEQIALLNQMKDQLFTAVYHDIRNPLAAQVNLVQLLEEGNERWSRGDHEIIQALGEQVRRTYTNVENLLEWFRGQKEGIVLRPESLLVSEIIEEASQLLLLNCEAKQVTLQVDIEEDCRVYVDREALTLIIRNLLSNAIKYSHPGGMIRISAVTAEGGVRISVADHGVGMSEDQIRHLFDDTRFDSTVGTAGEKGTGLGLLVSRQFLHMCAGQLNIHSRPGTGSTFTIVLEDGDRR